ncbi:MAG: T9SS type A sorting domain-containing protein, partial [Bacteroidota bacterium]
GEIYFDSTGFVEYRAGNLPIIISAPHGGNWRPDSIPDRNCSGCSYGIDSYTRVISWGMYDAFVEQTGCYPHLIMNRLHRIKFDANRDIGDAADGNLLVEQAWQNYHAFIDSAKAKLTADFGRGLFLDIHGHAHTIQRIELGYLLSRAELQMPDSSLNSIDLIAESSIRSLSGDNIQAFSHAQLLRGVESLGSLLDLQGFPSVPSFTDPHPNGNEAYFSGGYNTVRHGSRDNGGSIDAIQIELNQSIRFDDSTRAVLIDSLTASALAYYSLHYDSLFVGNFCNQVSSIPQHQLTKANIALYPNPTFDSFTLGGDWSAVELQLFNSIGQILLRQRVSSGDPINITSLESGFYTVQIRQRNQSLGFAK